MAHPSRHLQKQDSSRREILEVIHMLERLARFTRFPTILVLPLAFAGTLLGQADRATVAGHVTDSTGAALPGVTITARDNASGATFTAKTNSSGAYSIEQLPIGNYSIQMHHDGFRDAQSVVHLVATQVQALDVSMQVGSTSEVVGVSADPD